jgi:sugar phosphate isomerase/epimerase
MNADIDGSMNSDDRFLRRRSGESALVGSPSRRGFLAAAAGLSTGAAAQFVRTLSASSSRSTTIGESKRSASERKIRLGFDNFAVRAAELKADGLIGYAASLKIDSLFISDLDALESFEADYLKRIREKATAVGIGLHLGTWSICPTSVTFKPKWGTADEHLALGLRTAHRLGSPVLRVILGNGDDRKTKGGIGARIDDLAKVCKKAKSTANDLEVKIAIENHAGDMQARELARLVEQAGPDFVGVNLDSGNSTWTYEDPYEALLILGKYALTTSLRDSMVWKTANGVAVQWTAMGDGLVDWKRYFTKFAELCPNVPVHIETISGFSREFPIWKRETWDLFPEARAADLAAFLAFAERGRPIKPFEPPAGTPRKQAEVEYQKREVERSLEHCRGVLASL